VKVFFFKQTCSVYDNDQTVREFNVVHFPCNYTRYIKFKAKLLHEGFSLLINAATHFGLIAVGHLQGVRFLTCAAYASTYVVESLHVKLKLLF
jgi:hypothetical protein